jgi:hypothetical protein
VPAEVEVAAVVHALDLLEAERAAEVELDVERGARVVRELVRPCAWKCSRSSRSPRSRCHCMRSAFQYSNHCMWSDSGIDEELHLHLLELARAEREVPGVISLRNALPICAMPNGTFCRVLCWTFRKLTKIPCAVSGRR